VPIPNGSPLLVSPMYFRKILSASYSITAKKLNLVIVCIDLLFLEIKHNFIENIAFDCSEGLKILQVFL